MSQPASRPASQPSHATTATTATNTTNATNATRRKRVPGAYGREEIAENRLEPWPNPKPERDYVVHFEIPEFTCVCPRSGFPDFATIVIDYAPGPMVVELKSLKLYINGYRDRAISHEATANQVLDDLIEALHPRWMRVVAEFNVRGNIKTVVYAEQAEPGYAGPRPAYQRPSFMGI